MIKLFVNPEDTITIKLAVAVDQIGNQIYVDANKKDLEIMLKDVEHVIEEYEVVFKRPSFKDAVEINQSLYSSTIDGKISFNPLQDRYKKITSLIKSWNLTNENGDAMEPNKDNVNKLHPTIAEFLANQLDAG